jgi:hypothetical protein
MFTQLFPRRKCLCLPKCNYKVYWVSDQNTIRKYFRTIHILFPKRFCYKYTDFGFLRNYLSWQSVLLVEESGLPGENHRPVAYHWQTLSHNGVSSTSPPSVGFELTTLEVIGTDCTGSCKSNYHTITTTTAPQHTIITVCRW